MSGGAHGAPLFLPERWRDQIDQGIVISVGSGLYDYEEWVPPVRVEGCAACHNPHGSTNPRLLTRPAVFTMCLECHNSVMGFGPRGQGIPVPGASFHNLADPSFQNCVTCHPRIHGSNSDPLFRR